MVNVHRPGDQSGWIVGGGLTYAELEPVLKSLKLAKPENLVGFKYDDRGGDPFSGDFDYVRLQALNGGKYVPPRPEVLFDRAANALVKLECPTFADVDRKTVTDAFAQAYGHDWQANPKWLEPFRQRIKKISNGTVEVENANVDDFGFRIRGQATYLKATNGRMERKMAFGPYSKPFDCLLKEPVNSPIRPYMSCYNFVSNLISTLRGCFKESNTVQKPAITPPYGAQKRAGVIEAYEVNSRGLDKGGKYILSAFESKHVSNNDDETNATWADDDQAMNYYLKLFLEPEASELESLAGKMPKNAATYRACFENGVPADWANSCSQPQSKSPALTHSLEAAIYTLGPLERDINASPAKNTPQGAVIK